MQFFELERRKVSLSFHGKCVMQRLDLLPYYRVIESVDRRQDFILNRGSLKFSTNPFFSIEPTVSPILLPCTFVSLATNGNISAFTFFSASVYRSVWSCFSASFWTSFLSSACACNWACGLRSVYVFSSTFTLGTVPTINSPSPRWLFRQLSHSPPLLASKRVWWSVWAIFAASIFLSVRTSSSATLFASVSTTTLPSSFSCVLPSVVT